MKEFEMDKKIKFPRNIIKKEVGEFVIVLAPDYPNWIVLNQIENKLFDYLLEENVMLSMIQMRDIDGIEEECVINVTQNLLTKVESNKFYYDTEIKEEESIETIKKSIHINLTNDCNLRCKHCYMSAGLIEKESLNYEAVIKFLDDIYKSNGSTEVIISGGEPLVYSDLENVLRKCKELNHHVILFTNGLLIDNENIVMIKEYVDEIQISMEGISEYYYELIRGKGSYESLIEAFRRIKQYKIPLTLAVTVLDNVVQDIQDNIIRFLKYQEFKDINVRINDDIELKGNMLKNTELKSIEEMSKKMQVINIIKQLKMNGFTVIKSKKKNIHFTNCGIGTSIVLNYDGNIYPCNEFGCEFYSINNFPENIVEKFNELNRNTSMNQFSKCNLCELKYLCNGGCRIKNYIENGDFNKPYCTSEYKEKKYYELLTDYLLGVEQQLIKS